MNGKPGNSDRRIIIFATIIMLLAGLVSPALAAPPSPGAVLEGAKPPVTQPPAETKGPVVTVEGQPPQTGGQAKIPVQGFRIGGEPPVPADELLSLIKSEAGKEATLGELGALAGRLTQHLRR